MWLDVVSMGHFFQIYFKNTLAGTLVEVKDDLAFSSKSLTQIQSYTVKMEDDRGFDNLRLESLGPYWGVRSLNEYVLISKRQDYQTTDTVIS